MSVMSRSRKERINLSLQDVLRCKSIIHLSQLAGSAAVTTTQEEKIDEMFDLSPIQRMYFQGATGYQGDARFNQSFTLKLSRRIDIATIKKAMDALVECHSMLRARFSKVNKAWKQRVIKVSFLQCLFYLQDR
jgi:hypothetical protein